MNKTFFKYGLWFILFILSQAFVFDRIQITGFISPYVYVLFILILPLEIRGWQLLLTSFLLGFAVDWFAHTPGMHAAASVFMAFCRPSVLKLMGRREEDEAGKYPNIRDFATVWFLIYTLILVFLHHLFLFTLESLRFSEILIILLKVLINTALTTAIIMIIEFLFYSRRTE